MDARCLLKLCMKVLLFTSFFKTFESNVELPTVTVRGFLNFKTTVDGTVIVFTPVSETRPSTAVPKPVTTSSALFPASVEAIEGAVQENDFIEEKGMQDSPQNNFLSPLSSSQSMEESHVSENAVLLPSHQGDKTKKAAPSREAPRSTVFPKITDSKKTDVFDTSKHIFSSMISEPTPQLVSSSTPSLHSSKPIEHALTPATFLKIESEKPMSDAPRSSGLVASAVNSALLTEHVSSSIEVLHSGNPIERKLKSDTVLRSTESKTPMFDASHTSEQIASAVNSALLTKHVSSSIEVLHSSSPTEHTLKSVTFSKSIQSERTMSDVPHTPEQMVSTMNSESVTERVSTVPTLDSTLLSSAPLAVEISSPATLAIAPAEFEISSSVPVESISEVVNSSPSVRRATSNSVEYTESHALQSSFKPLTVSSTQKSTESLMTLGEFSSPYDEESKKNSSRTRFLSLRRPSQSVRLNRFKVKLTLRQDSPEEVESEDEELLLTPESTPAKVVFKETTVTSEVTLHVGRKKSVRLLTITTSVPMTVHPTDMSHILLDTDQQEEELNVETRTFTTTERVLKTSIVPVYDGKSTAYHKVTESFFIMKFITAYKTLPTGEITVLDEITMTTPDDTTPMETRTAIPPLQNQFLSFGHALSNNPLAAVYLGLQQLNAQMTLYSTITDTSTYVTTETFYNTKTVRMYDGKSNRVRTVSEPTSTKTQTVTKTVTSVRPYINTQAMQQQQRLQQFMVATQLPEPQFETKTSIYTTKTISTSLSTRVYTLIYNGFSTKFRTITSTTTYPTTITVTSTTKVPLSPTQFYS